MPASAPRRSPRRNIHAHINEGGPPTGRKACHHGSVRAIVLFRGKVAGHECTECSPVAWLMPSLGDDLSVEIPEKTEHHQTTAMVLADPGVIGLCFVYSGDTNVITCFADSSSNVNSHIV